MAIQHYTPSSKTLHKPMVGQPHFSSRKQKAFNQNIQRSSIFKDRKTIDIGQPFYEQGARYSLYVKDDLMLSNDKTGWSFKPGDLLIVAPGQRPRNGSFVIAHKEGESEAILRQYKKDLNRAYLCTLKPGEPDIEMDDTIKICGLVVGMQKDGNLIEIEIAPPWPAFEEESPSDTSNTAADAIDGVINERADSLLASIEPTYTTDTARLKEMGKLAAKSAIYLQKIQQQPPRFSAKEAENNLIDYIVNVPFLLAFALKILLEPHHLPQPTESVARILCTISTELETLLTEIIKTTSSS